MTVGPVAASACLSAAASSAGVLAPVFKPVTVAYSLAVGFADSLVAVTALTTDPAATLLINGKPVEGVGDWSQLKPALNAAGAGV